MKCKRCGRKLKNENSCKLGYGPVCAIKEGIIIPKIIKYKNNQKYINLIELNERLKNESK